MLRKIYASSNQKKIYENHVDSGGRNNMKRTIKKGSSVLVIAGANKGHKGVVEKVIKERAIVSNTICNKKHIPGQRGERGSIINKPRSIHMSNLVLLKTTY